MATRAERVFLMGGAGNQLFQLARAHSHIILGRDAELVKLGRFKEVIYKIIGFTYHKDWIDPEDISSKLGISLRQATFGELFILGIHFILKKCGVSIFFDREMIEGAKYGLDVGYFQSPKHVLSESIATVGKCLSNFLGAKSNPLEFVVHVRGGDFTFAERMKNSQARAIAQYASDNSLELKVVTNDATFATELFSFLDYEFLSNGRNARDDFQYLCGAKTLYLSNSTFAFWGAVCSLAVHSAVVFAPSDFPHKDLLDVAHLENF
jgi:hypothetical protein